jgi:D-alanyl-lipoteichoic acid acyltransferase DltB (MBOAT superfamily)
MNFCFIEYLFFLPLVVLLFFLTKHKYRWIVLFVGSCAFYMSFIPEYILYLFFLIIVDYFMAIQISNSQNDKRRKVLLWISVISNFGLLFYFKYSTFFAENINLIIEPLFHSAIKIRPEILPIGLSFHSFQSISYVIDVHRKKQVPERNIFLYSNFVLFFPQMVAGPIERYSTLGANLKENIKFNFSSVKKGAQLILIGFFYKMVIADNCGLYVNNVYAHVNTMNGLNVLLAVLLFTVQIYCDFFGYSLIAQGSAKMIGINLMDNFRNPLLSFSIVDFWKRWHISLTNWFREYVYYPLGGSREGNVKHIRNIAIIFLLSGLWHGAGWNFIAWGGLHAIFYLIALYGSGMIFEKFPVWIKFIATFFIVSVIFIFSGVRMCRWQFK